MMNSRMSLWAAAGATAMTLATGMFIGALAQVDTAAAGLPVVRLERVEIVGSRTTAPQAAIASGNASETARGARGML